MAIIKKIFGFIYLLVNVLNGKIYVGKTEIPRTIEDRWKEHLKEGKKLKRLRERYPEEKINGTHLNNALVKYGESVWNLKLIDIAYNKNDLNEKERYWIKKNDSINPKVGYNMREGGEGGKLRPEIIERIRKSCSKKSTELWLDQEYRKNVVEGIHRSRQEDPTIVERIRESTKKAYEDPLLRQKISDAVIKSFREDPTIQQRKSVSLKKRYEIDPTFKQKISKKSKENWEDPQWKEAQIKRLAKAHEKEISDMRQFLADAKNNVPLRDLEQKYNLSHTTIVKKIKEWFVPYGPENLTQLKRYLQNRDIDDVLKEIKNKHINHIEANQSWKTNGRKVIIYDKRDFFNELKNKVPAKILTKKFLIGHSALNRKIKELFYPIEVKNYREAVKYIQDKDIDEVLREIKSLKEKKL